MHSRPCTTCSEAASCAFCPLSSLSLAANAAVGPSVLTRPCVGLARLLFAGLPIESKQLPYELLFELLVSQHLGDEPTGAIWHAHAAALLVEQVGTRFPRLQHPFEHREVPPRASAGFGVV